MILIVTSFISFRIKSYCSHTRHVVPVVITNVSILHSSCSIHPFVYLFIVGDQVASSQACTPLSPTVQLNFTPAIPVPSAPSTTLIRPSNFILPLWKVLSRTCKLSIRVRSEGSCNGLTRPVRDIWMFVLYTCGSGENGFG